MIHALFPVTRQSVYTNPTATHANARCCCCCCDGAAARRMRRRIAERNRAHEEPATIARARCRVGARQRATRRADRSAHLLRRAGLLRAGGRGRADVHREPALDAWHVHVRDRQHAAAAYEAVARLRGRGARRDTRGRHRDRAVCAALARGRVLGVRRRRRSGGLLAAAADELLPRRVRATDASYSVDGARVQVRARRHVGLRASRTALARVSCLVPRTRVA